MPDPTPATILLVDDREANRYAVSRILQKAGFAVREAGTGQDALRQLADKPDLLILDINLPDLTGYEVCRRVKADPATAAIPVLHLSASMVESENRSLGLEGGADGYLTYPLEPRELVAQVQALLRIRRAEHEIRAQRELLRVTLSSIGDGVVATNPAGVITFINPVAQALTGWTEGEALGRPLGEVFQILNEETGQSVDNPVARVIRSGQVAGLANHTLLVARDGTRRPIDDSAAPIRDDEGRFVGVVLVFRDITDRRALEAELRRQAEELVERDRRKDEFLALLAHELRNPLAPVRNTLQLLRLTFKHEAEVMRAAGVMDRQVSHLVRLVDDLMDVSRITRGKLELRKQRVDLAQVVTRSLESARPALEERQHRLHVQLPATPVWLEADPARLEQALSNLLTNAAKYTGPGGDIRLTAGGEGREAVVRVQDNGIGIRPEVLPSLFEMFQQADRLPGRVAEGLGLGLALVRTLVQLHGGDVTAASAGPGQGSTFVVRLPSLPADGAEANPALATEAGRLPVLSRRILVVDDHADVADSLAAVLRHVGHDVRTAGDGQQALAVARAFRPEAIFLDISLPRGMDGYEVARRLRREPDLAGVLLVAITGFGQPHDRTLAHDAGFDHHIVKPADPEGLQKILAQRPPAGGA